MPSQALLKQLVAQQGAGLGLDDDSSAIVINNINATTMPICTGNPFDEDEEATDDFRLVFFVVDKSGSMSGIEDEVRRSFNEIVIPGLLGGAASQVGAIRINGVSFNDTVDPLWGGGWQKLSDTLPELTTGNYTTDGCTALHKAVLDAITAAVTQSLEIEAQTGTRPEVTIAVLSDGANNRAPHDPKQVFGVASKLSKELFTLVFIGFETFEAVDFHDIAKSIGFNDVLESKAKSGETKEQQQRRFRNMMGVFSSKLVQRTSTSRVGQPPSQTTTGGSGFFD